MGENTNIEWADHTFNPWIGCTKVSAGCDNCYAEQLMDIRMGRVEWGPDGDRSRTKPGYWSKPLAWNRAAEAAGVPARVFCASLADVFDAKAPDGALNDLWELIRVTPWLCWLVLTKRPQRIKACLPDDWGDGWPNVWLGVSTEDQETFDRRWPLLSAVPAVVWFVSYEPALGPLEISSHVYRPDWLIWGGESGPGARAMRPEWARAITMECHYWEVPVFGKQWGTYASNPFVVESGVSVAVAQQVDPKENGKGGALLDGKLWREFPQ